MTLTTISPMGRAAQWPGKALQFGCRLFIYMAPRAYEGQDRFIRQCLVDGVNSLRTQSMLPPDDANILGRKLVHTDGMQDDGWGFAIFNRPGLAPIIHKEPHPAHTDPAFPKAVEQAANSHPQVFLAHLRQGREPSMRNTHPFTMGRWAFVHNGNLPLSVKADLSKRLLDFHRKYGTPLPQGRTDTEQVFLYMVGQWQAEHNVRSVAHFNPSRRDMERIFNRTVNELARFSAEHPPLPLPADKYLPGIQVSDAARLWKSAGLNFVLSDGQSVFASCYGRPLYVGVHRAPDGKPRELMLSSRPLQPAADSGQEPIEWEAIPNGHLLRLDHDNQDQLHFHVTPVVSSTPPQGFLSRLLGQFPGKRGLSGASA